MARQELDMTEHAEENRLERLWDAYKAQEDELVATQKDLDTLTKSHDSAVAKFAKEQERLEKLWDAYRSQEDELKDLKVRLPLMEEKLVERERTITSQQRDIALLEPLTKKGRVASDLEQENAKLLADIEVLKTQVKATKGGDSSKELAAEKERLAKLYTSYQDLEAENKQLKKTIKEWEAWAKKVRPALES